MFRTRHDGALLPGTLRRDAIVALMLAALAACSTTPQAPSSDATTATTPTTPRSSGGGYYLDDGPGDDIPPDLDRIADAQPRAEPLHRFANRPYVVLGQQYTPATERKPYRARGIASWYGRRFHGELTSSGEPYDMYAMTGAHTTLPIPSYVRVTNLANGRSVVVRINDRGPFLHGRLIDLSYAAAYRLGYVDKGSTLVEVEAVDPEVQALSQQADKVATTAPAAGSGTSATVADGTPASRTQAAVREASAHADAHHYVQLGAFATRANAERLRSRIVQDVSASLDRAIEVIAQEGLFRVRLGPYATLTEASDVAARLRAALDLQPWVVR